MSCSLSPVLRADDCYVYTSLSQKMTVRTSMNLRKDSEREKVCQKLYFVCYSLTIRKESQTKKCLLTVVDTWRFYLLTEPDGQLSNLLAREEHTAEHWSECCHYQEQYAVVISKGGNVPRYKQLFIAPSCQAHQSFSDQILQWALLPFGPQSCMVRLFNRA